MTVPRRGWALRSDTLAAWLALAFTLLCNGLFWHAMLEGRPWSQGATWLWLAAWGVALWALHFVLFNLLLNRFTGRWLAAVLIVATAFAVYYMQRFTLYLDPSMLRNVVRTDVKEASELFTWGLLPHLLLYAVLPLALLWRVRLVRVPWWRSLGRKVLGSAVALGLAAGAVFLVFQDAAATMRNHKELRYLITPANYLYSMAKVLADEGRDAGRPKQPIGEDARRTAEAAARRKPLLMVMVLGETARGANWGLNGYSRQTTPQLAKVDDLVNFAQMGSCGTNTEVSVPCLFSPWGRRGYDEARIRGSQSLLHVLARAGLDVRWRDNQSGCKGVCDGLPEERLAQAGVPGMCDGERCLDDVLLHGLAAQVQPARDQLIVLHQLGNHGPAYYRRFPPAFKRFTPQCETPDLKQCTREQITNAYDNALLYTDDLLARTVAFLKSQQATHEVALVYVSDHGESLGEHGLYLHGLPYALAPKDQTWVPAVMWFSPGYAHALHLDVACLRSRSQAPSHHDNVFHTLMGLLQVQSSVYEPAMDLSAACRPATGAPAAAGG